MPDRLKIEVVEALGSVRSQLEYLRDLGEETLPRPASIKDLPVCSPGQDPVSAAGHCRLETLEEIRAELGDCCRCGLGNSRNQLVFGAGNPVARLVLVGEAPGREEDRRGEPFVGEAGQLLDRILLAMGLSRSDVYICNLLKCRPPDNRDPLPEEIEACESFLIRQLAAIGPQVIIAMGRFAAQNLLRSKLPIGRLRGNWHSYQGIPLMPTFHPAYLLRNPSGKRDVWEDMKQVIQRLHSLEDV
ncbi:MAG: uracil-DNA glycosylase [Desulfuromonadales bacterium]|nr:uracil-DNA glycosylase [Desulfuromonadales bacterium]